MKSKRQPRGAVPSPPPAVESESLFIPAAVALAVALAVRLVHLWNIRGAPFFTVLMGDSRGYDQWAQRLASGDWFGRDVFYQAPLYPYFLGVIYALAGRDLLAVRVIQACIGSVSCVLVGLAAARLFSRRAGWFAGLAMALYAPAIFFDSLIQKSVLDVFFISLALWLLAGIVSNDANRARSDLVARAPVVRWVLLGLTMGALSLTRENALLLVLVVGAWIAFTAHMRRTRTAAAFLLGVALVLVPVMVRNNIVSGGWYLTTSQFGPNFYIGNNPRADGTYASLRFGRGAPEYERQDATELAEVAAGRTLTPAEVSSFWTDRAMAFITSQPAAWLKLLGRKALLLVNATEMLDTESEETYAEWSWPLRLTGWFMHFGLLVPLAVLGLWLAWPERRRLAIFYALTAAYALSVIAFYVFARYRFPLVPLLMIFAAAAVGHGRRRSLLRTGAGAPHGVRSAVAVAAVAAVIANWPLLSKTRMQAITENNLAAALQADGRLDEAVAHYGKAIAIQPDYAPAYNNLGVALRASGKMDAAIQSYERALKAVPGYPDAHYNLANALLEQNKPGQAAVHYREALKSIPGSAGAHNNLGIALAGEGRLDEAISHFEQAVRLDDDSAQAHKNLGSALVDRGQVNEGVEHLQRATRIDPNDPAAHYDLGSVYLAAAQFMDAAVEFRWALDLEPDMSQAHNNLGVALASQGYLEEAIGHFKRALELDPSYTDAQRNMEAARKAIR